MGIRSERKARLLKAQEPKLGKMCLTFGIVLASCQKCEQCLVVDAERIMPLDNVQLLCKVKAHRGLICQKTFEGGFECFGTRQKECGFDIKPCCPNLANMIMESYK